MPPTPQTGTHRLHGKAWGDCLHSTLLDPMHFCGLSEVNPILARRTHSHGDGMPCRFKLDGPVDHELRSVLWPAVEFEVVGALQLPQCMLVFYLLRDGNGMR